jgi:hypothetical protein
VSTLNVDKVDPSSGTALELGTSGDTITVPTGAGLTVVDEVKTNKISPATGTAFALGDSGDTFTVPSGATIVNSGTATGFGGGKVLQVVSTLFAADTSTSSASLVATGHIATLPSLASTSSKILILQSVSNCYVNILNYGMEIAYYSSIDSASYAQIGGKLFGHLRGDSNEVETGGGTNNYLYSPSTTDSVSIQVYYNCTTTGDTYYGNGSAQANNLTLMEIGA